MRIVVALLALLLLAPAASAAPALGLRAESVSTDGDLVLEGALAGIRQLDPGTDVQPTPVDLFLHARSLTVENHTRGGLSAGQEIGLSTGIMRARTETTYANFTDATVIEQAARVGRDVAIFPLDARIRVEGRSAILAPASQDVLTGVNQVASYESTVNKSVEVKAATPLITVTGDFVVVLWELDVQVDHAQGNQTYFSGDDNTPSLASYSIALGYAPGPSTSNYTELVLIVHDGTLQMQKGNGPLLMFADHPTVHMSRAELSGVTGTLPAQLGGTPIQGGTLRLEGDLQLDLSTGAGRLLLDIGGHLDAATLNGQHLAVVAPLPTGRAARSWLPWASTAAILGIAAVGFVPLHRHNAQRRLEDAELLFAAGHFQAAADVARPVFLGGVSAPARALQIQALLHAGRVEEARRLAVQSNITEPGLKRLVQLYVGDWEGST